MKAYWCKATLVLVALSGCALAQSETPSLADIARQTRDGKKKAAIVLSDEDQRFSRSTTPSTTAAALQAPLASTQSGSAAPSSKSDAVKPATPAEPKGAAAASAAKQKLDFYKSQLDAWKGITRRDEESLAKETVPFRQQMYQDALDGDRQTTTFFQQKLDELQNKIDNSKKEDAGSAGDNASSSGSGR